MGKLQGCWAGVRRDRDSVGLRWVLGKTGDRGEEEPGEDSLRLYFTQTLIGTIVKNS